MRLRWVNLVLVNPFLEVCAHTLSWLGSEGEWSRGFGQEYPVAAPYNHSGYIVSTEGPAWARYCAKHLDGIVPMR